MSFKQRKSKHGPVSELVFENDDTRKAFAELRWRTVNDKTPNQCDGAVRMLEEKHGGSGFSQLADYIINDKTVTVATKRGKVSAVADVRWCRYEPLPMNAVQELTWALDVRRGGAYGSGESKCEAVEDPVRRLTGRP
jgi:hypothetical protein